MPNAALDGERAFHVSLPKTGLHALGVPEGEEGDAGLKLGAVAAGQGVWGLLAALLALQGGKVFGQGGVHAFVIDLARASKSGWATVEGGKQTDCTTRQRLGVRGVAS